MSRRLLQLVFLAVPVSAFANLSLSGDTLIWQDRSYCPYAETRIEGTLSPDLIALAEHLVENKGDANSHWEALLASGSPSLIRIRLIWSYVNQGLREAEASYSLARDRDDMSLEDRALVAIDFAKILTSSNYTWRRAEDVVKSFAVDQMKAEPDGALGPELWLAFGDWMIITGSRKYSGQMYQKAWNGFEAQETGSADRVFFEPKLICQFVMLSREFVNDYNSSEGPIAYSFKATISKRGYPKKTEFSVPFTHNFPATGALSVARKTAFRPAMRDGKLVETKGFEFERIVYRGSD